MAEDVACVGSWINACQSQSIADCFDEKGIREGCSVRLLREWRTVITGELHVHPFEGSDQAGGAARHCGSRDCDAFPEWIGFGG